VPNDFFEFKSFRIDQGSAAFKVGTDSCLLGAWIDVVQPKQILDVGTGTGLLALMLAQRTAAEITAIDIDLDSVQCARENASQSPWRSRIQVCHQDAVSFCAQHPERFDLIVSNPPVFKNSLQNTEERKRRARHDSSLTLHQLSGSARLSLKQKGVLAIVLPQTREHEALRTAFENGFRPSRLCRIHPSPEKEANRSMIEFKRTEEYIECEESELTLYQERDSLSAESIKLLQPFYLHL